MLNAASERLALSSPIDGLLRKVGGFVNLEVCISQLLAAAHFHFMVDLLTLYVCECLIHMTFFLACGCRRLLP